MLLEKFRLDFQTHLVGLYGGTMAADMAHLSPAKLVPTPRMPDGTVVGESLAIAETLAEHHPDTAISYGQPIPPRVPPRVGCAPKWPATLANCAGNAPCNFNTSTKGLVLTRVF